MQIIQMLIQSLIYHQQNHMDCSEHSSHPVSLWVLGRSCLTVVGTCFPKFRFLLESLSCVIGTKYCEFFLKWQAHFVHVEEMFAKYSSLNSHNLSIKSLFQAQMVMYAKAATSPLHDWESHSDTFSLLYSVHSEAFYVYLSVLWR